MRPPTATVLAALVLVIVVAGGIALEVVLADPRPVVPPVASARPAASGAWYCAVGSTAKGNALQVVAAVPPGQDVSSAMRVDSVAGGRLLRGFEVEVLPGSQFVQAIAGGHRQVGVTGRWWRTPAAISRVWRRAAPGEPGGRVEGACEPEPSTVWYLPGVTTEGGAQAAIVVANPFETDAAISVDLLSAEGLESPQLLRNVGVPARSVRSVDLNRYAPERADLGAVVSVRAGRVIAEAWQSLDPAVGGIAGMSLAKLARSDATAWTVPWFEGGRAESWLWAANVTDRAASLSLTVHTRRGGLPPKGLEEVTVPPASVRRIHLRGALPKGVRTGGVTVNSVNGVPVVVSSATRIGSRATARTGLALQLGQPAPDPIWTISSGGGARRREILHLVNPTASPAVVSIQVTTGADTIAPKALQRVGVPPGTGVDVDVGAHLPDIDHHTIAVVARQGAVVAGLHAFDRRGRLELVASSGVPSAVWAGGRPVPTVAFRPGLIQGIGTSQGPAATPAVTLQEVATLPDEPTLPVPTVSPT